MEYHGDKYNCHAKCHGYNEYCVQLSDKRERRHMFNGPEPQGGQYIFEAKDAAEHKPKDDRKNTSCRNNPCKGRLFKVVYEAAANQEQKALPYIAKHDAKNKRVGQAHKYGWIHLIMGRKAVHLYKHLKRFKYFGIFQFSGWFPEIGVVIILNHHKNLVIISDFQKEPVNVFLSHPSA